MRFVRLTLGFCAGLVSLQACAGSVIPPASTARSAAPPAATLPTTRDGWTPHPDRAPSWIAPDLKPSDLMYVSDVGTGDVDIYSYPEGRLRGQLTGFKFPAGLCADKDGDVYVTELFGAKIVEFRHGATKRMRTIRDPVEDPGDCSVDPTTGNLAVTNVSTPYSGPGEVLIYDHAAGKPHHYKDSSLAYYQFCSYDSQGNLFVDGTLSGNFQLAELPNGQKPFTNISVDEQIAYAGGVHWDGTSLAVGDYESNKIYQFSISGSSGTEVGKTVLKGANFPIDFAIQGSRVIAPNDEGASVMYWKYPAGGKHVKVIHKLSHPWGVVISHRK